MVFGLLTDVIETGLNVTAGLFEGELPTKRELAKLIDAGITIYAVSEMTGIAVDVLEGIADEGND